MHNEETYSEAHFQHLKAVAKHAPTQVERDNAAARLREDARAAAQREYIEKRRRLAGNFG